MILKDYHNELRNLAAKLNTYATASVRGEGEGSFVFAKSDHGAIELSKSDDGIWVEYWRGSNEEPETEKTFSSYNEAIESIICWLKGI